MSSSYAPYKPVWWLPDGHSQTLWRKFAPAPAVQHRRQRIELADGDFIDLDWLEPGGGSQSGLLVLVIHGLCGCSSSPYVTALQDKLHGVGISSVAMNLRGCSGEFNRLARSYHSGVSDDLDAVYSYLRYSSGYQTFVAVGYSLGANVLLKWLGESSGQPALKGAVAVSTPFDLAACSRAMLSGLSRAYGNYFKKRLLEDFRAKCHHFREHGDATETGKLERLALAKPIHTIWDFDEQVTAPLNGFDNAQDYYSRCSSLGFLSAITNDTLLIQSANDPLIPEAALPRPAELPASVQLELSPAGGHVGFYAGRDVDWLESRITSFVMS